MNTHKLQCHCDRQSIIEIPGPPYSQYDCLYEFSCCNIKIFLSLDGFNLIDSFLPKIYSIVINEYEISSYYKNDKRFYINNLSNYYNNPILTFDYTYDFPKNIQDQFDLFFNIYKNIEFV